QERHVLRDAGVEGPVVLGGVRGDRLLWRGVCLWGFLLPPPAPRPGAGGRAPPWRAPPRPGGGGGGGVLEVPVVVLDADARGPALRRGLRLDPRREVVGGLPRGGHVGREHRSRARQLRRELAELLALCADVLRAVSPQVLAAAGEVDLRLR